jgi:sugar phosphate isomerase/epimerase
MTNRRQFLKLGLGATAFALPALHFTKTYKAALPAPGVQLFTFYNVLDNDVEGTLKKAASIGIKNIESAFSKKGDYYGLPAKQFASLLKNLGMEWRSHHVFGMPFKTPPPNLPHFKNLQENLNEILEDASAGGLKYLVAAHLPITNGDEVKVSLDILNKSAEACQKAGIQLIYHNEPADFANIDGKTPYEVFLTQTNSSALKFELDVAWAVKAGQDPVKLIEQYPGRFPLWHVKDLTKDYSTVLPVGDGVLDYKTYFSHAAKGGLEYYFLEHEAAQDPITSLSKSIQNLQSITM